MVSHFTVRSNIRAHATDPLQYDCHSLLPSSSFQLLERYDEMDGLYRQCTTSPLLPPLPVTRHRMDGLTYRVLKTTVSVWIEEKGETIRDCQEECFEKKIQMNGVNYVTADFTKNEGTYFQAFVFRDVLLSAFSLQS